MRIDAFAPIWSKVKGYLIAFSKMRAHGRRNSRNPVPGILGIGFGSGAKVTATMAGSFVLMLKPCYRLVICFSVFVAGGPLRAQPIDSLHVYGTLEPGPYTSASANALAWKLHREHALHTTVKGTDLAAAAEALEAYTPMRHGYGPMPGLTHVLMAFSGGRAFALGVADDLDLVVNFTARKEYRISSYVDHLSLRSTLLKVLLLE